MSDNLRFTKMHGLGNDFIVIDTISQPLDWRSISTASLADRHLGIGCDQLLLIEPSSSADFFCRILNADGSEAEQCGNGLRCVARFLHEKGLHTEAIMRIETIAGIFPIKIKDYDNICVSIPTRVIDLSAMKIALPGLNTEVMGSSLSMGNPHFIIKVPDIQLAATNEVGRAIASHPIFPKGTNVGFMQIKDSGHIYLRTYERGVGETHACGSNACAAVAAGILDGSLSNAVRVDFRYGQLAIEWEGTGKPVRMTGPAALVFEGEYYRN